MSRVGSIGWLVAALALAPDISAGQGGDPARMLTPVDQAAAQPDFFTFRAHLSTAIARRDVEHVLSVVAPDVRNGFGGDDGLEAFRRLWRLDASDSPLWEELGSVLALGGNFDVQGQFTAPYVFAMWPEEVDAFENAAVIGSSVRVRSGPRRDAAVIGALSFAIVGLDRGRSAAPSADWTAIVLPDGRSGYIASEYLRSPIDYRAMFRKSAAGWRLIFLAAGD